MKLNVFYDSKKTTFSSVASCDYMNFFYDMNSSIKIKLNESWKKIRKAIIEEENIPLLEEDKKRVVDKLSVFKDKLYDVDKFMSCFDKIEIHIENIETFDRIMYFIEDINIPVILDLRDIDDQVILEKLPKIDEYLRNNKKIQVKYIVKQCLNEFEAHFEDNSYFLEDVMMVINYVLELANIIRSSGLSPLEQVMFMYDMVKDHKYIEANSTDSYLESRDLAKSLKNGKRVCVGFASLFKSLLDNLGFTNEMVFLDGIDNPMMGHVRNMVVVRDSKYDLDHILYFDATWDCKKGEKEKDDIDRYNFFARDRLFFLRKDYKKLKDNKKYDYFLRKDNDYSFLDKEVPFALYETKKIFKLINWEEYFINNNTSSEYMEKIKFLMVNDHASILLRDEMEFCEFFYKACCKMLNREISDKVFLRCLYTVRRIENKLYPDKYNFDKENIIDIYYDYCMWNSSVENKNFMKLIFSDSEIKKLDIYEEEDKNNNRLEVLNKLKSLCNSIDENNIDDNISVKEAVKIMKK